MKAVVVHGAGDLHDPPPQNPGTGGQIGGPR
jgi:hypothetical protein